MVSAGGNEEKHRKKHPKKYHSLEVLCKRKKETGDVSMNDSAFFRC